MSDHPHAVVLGIVHEEAGRTLSKEDFDLCMRIARHAFGKGYAHALPLAAVDARTLPAALTPPVRNVLSLMLWQTLPIANALRATGRHINRKTEDEQAASLHWLLGIALEHGDNWEQAAARALHKLLSEKKGV
jgi:hypothetical protein